MDLYINRSKAIQKLRRNAERNIELAESTGQSLAEEDMIAQAFSRLAIVLGYTNCDKDNDVCYHFDYLNKHFKVTIEVGEKQ